MSCCCCCTGSLTQSSSNDRERALRIVSRNRLHRKLTCTHSLAVNDQASALKKQIRKMVNYPATLPAVELSSQMYMHWLHVLGLPPLTTRNIFFYLPPSLLLSYFFVSSLIPNSYLSALFSVALMHKSLHLFSRCVFASSLQRFHLVFLTFVRKTLVMRLF